MYLINDTHAGKEIDQDLNLSKGMYLNANGSVTSKHW